MKRTQIQLDERTYELLRRKAFERGCSISAYVREVLAVLLGSAPAPERRSIRDFRFIGAGRSRQERRAPTSERHDEALADGLPEERRR